MMNTAEYERALAVVSEVLDAPEGSDAAKKRDSLVDEIVRYEDLHYPIGMPDLRGAITARLVDLDLTQDDSFFTDDERRVIRALLVGGSELPEASVRTVLEKLGVPSEVLDEGGRKG